METLISLLERLRQPSDADAWTRFVRLYTPLLCSWTHRAGLQDSDAADLIQDVAAVSADDKTLASAGPGVLLEGVVKNTPAERAGLKKGDRLVAVDGKPVKDATAFLALARTLPMGAKVEFAVVRDGKEQKFGVQLATPPRPRDRRFGYGLDLNSSGTGVLVDDVPEGSPAARAGLKKGDRIIALAGKPVSDVTAYANATNEVTAGTKVEVTVMRAGKQQTFQVQTAAARTSTPAARFGVVADFANDKDGILLADVHDGSPADEAGLREGDRITALNGKAVKEMRAYTSLLAGFREGDKVEVTVVRNGKTFTLRAVLK